ncbi:MAG: DUF952 domain-containing protein [Gordonia sp. (in: high G+C Gram-positive bacteria)]
MATQPASSSPWRPPVGVLLRLCPASEWDAIRELGGERPGPDESFIHLSAPHQVHRPANRIFGGRDDITLLVLDPDRLEGEIRWEAGVPDDPAAMRFPHLYGHLPVAAVVEVVEYIPDADGRFAPLTAG